jgi:cytochrome c peroxidase
VRAPWLITMSAVAMGCSAFDEPPLVVSPERAVAALPADVPQPGSKPTAAEVELGRSLFWDPILSGEQDVACATCHHPRFAYADGIALSIGVGGSGLGPGRKTGAIAHRTPRNSMTVLNVGWNGLGATTSVSSPADAPMFWDNRVSSLELQALKPIENQDEMRGDNFNEEEIVPVVLARLAATSEYVSRFEAAFGPGPITRDMLARAIASFERTLVSRSSFDRYMAGDDDAISHAAKRGLIAFVNSGCTRCHAGPMFSDFKLHRLGVPDVKGAEHDDGDGMDRFRTPSLRGVTKTGPFMHGGQLRTLREVLDFYSGVDSALDPDLADVVPVGFDEILIFLETVSDGDVDASIPGTVPSGLPPGGNIAAMQAN